MRVEAQVWEYFIDNVANDLTDHTPFLNSLGESGWELVAVNPTAHFIKYYYKRPKMSRYGS